MVVLHWSDKLFVIRILVTFFDYVLFCMYMCMDVPCVCVCMIKYLLFAEQRAHEHFIHILYVVYILLQDQITVNSLNRIAIYLQMSVRVSVLR